MIDLSQTKRPLDEEAFEFTTPGMQASRKISFPGIVLIAALFLTVQSRGAEGERGIQVSAGDWDRLESVVSFPFPPGHAKTDRLIDADGHAIPLQTDEENRATFVLKNLKSGQTQDLQFGKARIESTVPGFIQVVRDGNKLRVSQGNDPIIGYQAEPGELPRPDINPLFTRGGYIHPILSPSGKLVSDDYPRNHIHHHGIWFPWTKTEFEGRHPDFWNMGDGTGKVEFESLSKTWSGPVHGGFVSRHRFIDLSAPQPKVALKETWRVAIYNVGTGQKRYRMFDMISTQNCATSSPLILPEYRYGGLGFRGNWSWNGAENAFFLTSEGETDRVKGHATRGRWCHIGGKVDGEWTGIAILCHPDNFRAPQPMRIHPTEPFFNFAPSQAGDWEIKPGENYVSRYRFVVLDGQPDKAELDRLWTDYAHPPQAIVK